MPPVESPRTNCDAGEEVPVEATEDSLLDNINSPASDNGGSNHEPSDAFPTESDDDSRKLFVGGLSWQTSESDLREYFAKWGKVTQCIIKLDKYTGNSRGFGFVTMENEDCVNKVLSVADHWLNNKRIDPKKAKPSKDTVRKVFVGGIDPDVTEDQIRDYFSTFGKIESLDLPFDTHKGKRKHYIFVSFTTEAAARKAVAKERQEIAGRQCDVRVAVTREQANRQKALKQWSQWPDPYAYAGQAYNDLSSAYFGYDPFLYGYYGCDYTNLANASGYGGYPAVNSAQFRNLSGAPKTGQPQRDMSGTFGPNNGNRHMPSVGGGGGGASVSMPAHRSLQPQSHSALNFGLVNPPEHSPFSTGVSGLDFTNPHPTHTPQSILANVAGNYPHQ